MYIFKQNQYENLAKSRIYHKESRLEEFETYMFYSSRDRQRETVSDISNEQIDARLASESKSIKTNIIKAQIEQEELESHDRARP